MPTETPMSLGASMFANAVSLQAAVVRGATDAMASSARIQRSAVERLGAATAAIATAWLPTDGPRAVHDPARKMGGTPADVIVGTEVTYTREVTNEEILEFAKACGDVNPVHFNDEYAKKNTSFGGVIAHGLLTASFISSALSRLPGVVIYMEQDLRFLKPVRPGDVVTARIVVTERPEGKSSMRLKTTCTLKDGTVVLDGSAKILLLAERAPATA